jgi:predicted DNA-binding transcriptional regulator YafY
MELQIKSAIEGNRIIQFDYINLPRIVEPYFLVTNKENEKYLLAYQVGGESITAENGWRQFQASRISGLSLTDEFFMQRNYEFILMVADIQKIIYAINYR